MSTVEGSDSEGKGEGANLTTNVILRFEEEGVKRIDLLKLPRVLRAQVGEIKYAKVLRDGNLLIGCNTKVQVEKARKLMGVCKVKVKNTARVGERRVNGSKGAIVGVQVTVSMQDLVENLKLRNGEVKGVRRMTRGPEKVETETVVAEFETKEVPKELFYGFVRFSVREYVPKPLRCFNCQKFRHIAKVCKGKRRCAQFSADREYGKCGVGVRPKCCSCGGEHSVAFWGCEVMKQQTVVQKTRVMQKVTYSMQKHVKKKEREKERQTGNPKLGEKQVLEKVMEMVERKMEEEKKKMVTFIAGVINATSDVKSKTARIQIIVKAACHSLDIKNIRWEDIKGERS